jgi:hypothetical protein
VIDPFSRPASSPRVTSATSDRQHKARLICPATTGCLTGVGNQLRLGPLDAFSQGGAAKQGQQARSRPQSLANIASRAMPSVNNG